MSTKLPQWYRDYHAWKYAAVVHWMVLILSSTMLLLGCSTFLLSANAQSITTTITEVILPGTLGLTLPAFLAFSPIQSHIDYAQVSTAILRGLTISDSRIGGDVGWSVTATCTDFVAINQPVRMRGKNDTLSVSGTYNDARAGIYTITIVRGGPVGIATFNVKGLEFVPNQTTGKNVQIGTRGVTATFAPTIYVPGDSWTIRVDTIPVSNLSIAPLVHNGGGNGIHIGSNHKFQNPNDPATIIFADNQHTAGNFISDLLFSLTIPPFTYANTYKATMTVTTD